MARVISHPELCALLRATARKFEGSSSSRRDCFLFLLMANTGLRISEALELRVSDLHLERSDELPYLLVNSLKKRRKIKEAVGLEKGFSARARAYIGGTLREILSRAPEPGDPLFPAVKGRAPGAWRPMTRRNAAKLFSLSARRAGLAPGASLHSLRHYRGSVLYLTTRDLRFTQLELRHSSSSSTARYLHHGPETRKRYHRELEEPKTP